MPPTVHIETDWSLWLLLFLVGCGTFVIVHGQKHKPILTALFVIVIGAFVAYLFEGKHQSAPQVAAVAAPAAPSLPSLAGVAHPNTHEGESGANPTLDALWEKITKSRIKLDADDSAPLADPKDEVAKEAIKKSFGLDEQGQLPPSWVIHPPKRVGKVLREAVTSDPFVTQAECRRQLEEEQLPHVVARQIGYLASARMGHSVRVDSPLSVGVGLDYIFREICRDEFTTTVDSPSVGEMKKVHVLVEFNPTVDQHLLDSWLRQERHQRLASFAKLFAMSITGLAAVYGLLRFDTWSKGYYSKQLLVGGILAIIAVAVFLMRVS